MDKRIKASHKSYRMHQVFIIYDDGTTDMFPILYDEDKPDVFFPTQEEFTKLLNALGNKPKK